MLAVPHRFEEHVSPITPACEVRPASAGTAAVGPTCKSPMPVLVQTQSSQAVVNGKRTLLASSPAVAAAWRIIASFSQRINEAAPFDCIATAFCPDAVKSESAPGPPPGHVTISPARSPSGHPPASQTSDEPSPPQLSQRFGPPPPPLLLPSPQVPQRVNPAYLYRYEQYSANAPLPPPPSPAALRLLAHIQKAPINSHQWRCQAMGKRRPRRPSQKGAARLSSKPPLGPVSRPSSATEPLEATPAPNSDGLSRKCTLCNITNVGTIRGRKQHYCSRCSNYRAAVHKYGLRTKDVRRTIEEFGIELSNHDFVDHALALRPDLDPRKSASHESDGSASAEAPQVQRRNRGRPPRGETFGAVPEEPSICQICRRSAQGGEQGRSRRTCASCGRIKARCVQEGMTIQDLQSMMMTFGRHLSEADFIRKATAAWHHEPHPLPAAVCLQTATSSHEGRAATGTSADVEARSAPPSAADATAAASEAPTDATQDQAMQNVGCCNLCNKVGQLSVLRGAKHTCVVCLKLRWAGERKGISRGNIRQAIQLYGNQLPVSEFVQKTLALVAEDNAEAAPATPPPPQSKTPVKRGRPRIGRRPRALLPERSPSPVGEAASSEDETPPPLEDLLAPTGDTYRGPCVVCGFHRLLSRTHRLADTCRRCMPARALCHQRGLPLPVIQRMYEELGGERMAAEAFADAAAAAVQERSPGLDVSVTPALDGNSREDWEQLELAWGRRSRVTEAGSSSGMEESDTEAPLRRKRPAADRASGLHGSGGITLGKRRRRSQAAANSPSPSPAPASADAGRSRSRCRGTGRPPRPLPPGLPPPGPALLATLPAPLVDLSLFEAKPASGSTQEDYLLHTIRYGRAPVLTKVCPLPLFLPPPAPDAPTATPRDTAPLTTTLSVNGSADVAADATSPNPFQKLQRARRRSQLQRDPSPPALPPAISVNHCDPRALAAAAAPASEPPTAAVSTEANNSGEVPRRGLRPRRTPAASDSLATGVHAQRSVSPPTRRATSTSAAATTADAAAPAATGSAGAVVSGMRLRKIRCGSDGARCPRTPAVVTPKTAATSEPGLRGWQASINSEAGIVRLHVALLSMAPTQQVTDATATLDTAVMSLAARRRQYAEVLAAGGPGCEPSDVEAAAEAERAAAYTERAARMCGRRRLAEQALLGLQVALQQAQHSQDSGTLAAAAAAAVAEAEAARAVVAGGAATAADAAVGTDPCASLMRAMKALVGELQAWAAREAGGEEPPEEAAAARPYDEQMRVLEACAKDAAVELTRLEQIYGMHDVSAYSPAHESAPAPSSSRRLAANTAAAAAAAEVVASSMPPATRAARSRSKRNRSGPASRATSQSTDERAATPVPTPEGSGASVAAPPGAAEDGVPPAATAGGPWPDKLPVQPMPQRLGPAVEQGAEVAADAVLQKRGGSGAARSMARHAGWDPPVTRRAQGSTSAAR